MIYSSEIAIPLVTLACGAAAIAILIKIAEDDKDMVIIRRKPIKEASADEKEIISQLAANKDDVISCRAASYKEDSISRRAENKKDMISPLPNQILISIVTRMGTKFAVRTSTLSRRWRNLYKFVPDINLSCHDLLQHSAYCAHTYYPYNHEDIVYRVERLLRLRCDSDSRSKIRSFHFRCPYADGFDQCIYSLGRLGVEELVLYFTCCKNFPSCRKFYCCKRSSDSSFHCRLLSEMPSLKCFRLALCSLHPSLESQFTSLQTLALMDVRVLPGALECILSNCLMLQSLIVDRCECPSKLCFHGRNLQLNSLTIKHCKGVEEIEFYASNLIMFEFQNSEVVNFIFDHVPQLQSVNLSVENKNIVSYVFGELAKDLPHLKSLAFAMRGDFYQESTRLMGMGIETFSNLTRLELKVHYVPETNLLALIIPFLERCPLLQEFRLDIQHNLEDDGAGAQVQPRKQVVLNSELKKVEISGFRGMENEMEFTSYILKSAAKLEQMHIIWRTRGYYDIRDMTPRRNMIEKQLQEQALSKTAQVIFSMI